MASWFGYRIWVFNQNGFHTRVSFRIYRETLSRFSCTPLHRCGGLTVATRSALRRAPDDLW
ncbi:hypothetical protein ABLN64_15085, partial [Mycobacterium tuberculosis]